MAFNSSRLPRSFCQVMYPVVNYSDPSRTTNNQMRLAASVVTALLAPMTVAGNAFILAAIWRNPSLRTPSYVLLAGLAITDFSTGLISQPFFAVYKVGEIIGNRMMHCVGGFVSGCAGFYFSSLTFVTITMIAVERWLYMSRRSLLTARRVVILYGTFAVVLMILAIGRMYNFLFPIQVYNTFQIIFMLSAGLCFILAAFAYFKVFQIIRHHQNQVQTNESAINMQKYMKSIFTILYILAIFFLSYVPFLGCVVVFNIYRYPHYGGIITSCSAVVFTSSFFSPLLYYCRIKEIKDSVNSVIRKLFCKESEAGS